MFTHRKDKGLEEELKGTGCQCGPVDRRKGIAFLEVCQHREQREKHQQQEENNERGRRLSWVEEKCDLEAGNCHWLQINQCSERPLQDHRHPECRPVAWTTKPINSGFLHCHSHDSVTRVNFYIFDVLFSFYLPEWKSLHWSAWGNVVPRRKIRT